MEDQQEGNGNTTSAPPPDWYENQDGVLQWWDGKAWGPVRPAEQVEVRTPGPYSVDGVRQWWDGTESWKQEELADLLTVRAANSQAAGWFRPPNRGVQWWDGARWIPDSEITQILVEDFDLSRRQYPTSQALKQPAQLKRSNIFGVCSVVLFLLSLLFFVMLELLLVFLSLVLGLALGITGLAVAKRQGLSRVSAVVGCILPIVLVVLALSVNAISGGGASTAQQSSNTDSSPRQEPQPNAEEQRNAQMEAQGFHTWQSGEVWLKAADPESYTCDYGTRCIWYQLVSYGGCAAGYYVKADILNANDVAIGWTNEITASVQPQDGVAFQLRSADNGGETIRVSEVSCMG